MRVKITIMKTTRSTVSKGINLSTRRHTPKKGKGSYNRMADKWLRSNGYID